MINPWSFTGGIAASVVCLAHVFLGGRLFVRPLLASDLRGAVKQTHYFCWHLVTAAIAAMAAGFAWAAFAPHARPAAIASLGLALAFVLVNASQSITMGLAFPRHPQGAFFAIVAALAAPGFLDA